MPIYLDFQATTPLDEDVLAVMLPWLRLPANAHAVEHAQGREAEAAIERAREQVAAAVNGNPRGVIFTSGATEAANIVLRSFAGSGRKVLISAIEHPCVDECASRCAEKGTIVERIGVDGDGQIDLDRLAEALDGSDLVSVMSVNNEVGTIQPIDAIAALCQSASVPFHTDAAQALGRVPIDMMSGISFATLSGHKIYGPQGIGAICADPDLFTRLRPLISGGGQQRGIRPGTVPVALCVGLGEACRIGVDHMSRDDAHCAHLSRLFQDRLQSETRFSVNGSLETRVPHNLNINFEGIVAEELLALLPELALSTGSACSSAAITPSRVLTEMGLSPESIGGSIRLGFGRSTREDEVILAAEMIGTAVRRLRGF
jgi:cysteine desulfurase